MEQLNLLAKADDQLVRELLDVIHSPTLCQAAKVAEVARLLAPYGLTVQPAVTHHCWTASDIAKELGVSAQAVGKLATRHQLKTDQYGEYRLTKSPHSAKQVESFVYNEAGRAALIHAMRTKDHEATARSRPTHGRAPAEKPVGH